MESAFGIDHGDVSKAFGAGILRSVGAGVGQAARGGAAKAGGMAGKNIQRPGFRALGRGQVKMGQGLRQISRFAAKKPGVVGGAAVGAAGAGAVGAGAVGSSAMNRNQRMPQYR
jgi:hypothetical protein